MKFRAFVWRNLFFLGIWLVLSGGHLQDWPLIVVAITAAAGSSLWLVPCGSFTVSFTGLVRFVPYFINRSFQGGWDVARRVLHPKLPLQSGVVEHTLSLKEEHSRVFFCWTISLLPGTVCVGLAGAEVRVHVLDTSGPIKKEFRELERAVAGVFGERVGEL